MVVLYIKVEAKLRSRKEAREAQGRDLESGAAQQAFDRENGGARRDSSSSDVSSLTFRFDRRFSSDFPGPSSPVRRESSR